MTLAAKGRTIRTEQRENHKHDATLHGVRPRRGLWLVHPEKGRVYGQIERVKRTGAIVVRARVCGVSVSVEHSAATLIDAGCRYVEHAVVL